MVWWINKYKPSPALCRSGRLCVYKALEDDRDVIFPSRSIMFTFNDRIYSEDIINYLIRSGVNIFNIDSTHDQFETQISLFLDARKLLQDSLYYVPVALAITLTIDGPISINNLVDIVILKDVSSLDQYLKLKKQYKEQFSSRPLLLWLKQGNMDDIEELIRFSDGIILDREKQYAKDHCDCVLRFSKKFYKPLFFNKINMVKEYYSSSDRDRHVIGIMQDVVDNNVDGISIIDASETELPPKDMVRSTVRAMNFADINRDTQKDYFKLSFEVPLLPSISAALAASLAAVNCGAKAIIVFSKTGTSARWCAFSSPSCPIIAITTQKSTAKCLHLYRRVIPLYYTEPRSEYWHQEWRSRVHFGTTFALKTRLLRPGAKLVVLAPSHGLAYCDAFQIITAPGKCDDWDYAP